jgi:hypothetical protein
VAAAAASTKQGLTFAQLAANTPASPYRLDRMMNAVPREEVDAGRVAFDGRVNRIRAESWAPDLLEAVRRLALPD